MEFEYSFKCGFCANKFASGMTKRLGDKSFCPTCGEEIVAFPSAAEIARHDYIAHTRRDRFHSIVSGDDDD